MMRYRTITSLVFNLFNLFNHVQHEIYVQHALKFMLHMGEEWFDGCGYFFLVPYLYWEGVELPFVIAFLKK